MPKHRPATRLTHAGRDSAAAAGLVNPPLCRGSTLLFDSLEALEEASRAAAAGDRPRYGRFGTPTVRDFESAIAELEGAAGAVASGAGLTAINLALFAFLRTGDELLVADSVYPLTRQFRDRALAPLGIETRYYDPTDSEAVAGMIGPRTRVMVLESPGSLTFEIQDVPRLAETAAAAGVVTILDNSWATPLFFRPLEHGVDVVLHAATKYINGHADGLLGVVAARTPAHLDRLRQTAIHHGHYAAPDEAWLALRGLRSLAPRLERHQRTGLALADWLAGHEMVARVLHPARPDHPGHALWRRDFDGATGLFSVLLAPGPRAALAAMLDDLELFAMGYSWGGYESLALPVRPDSTRTATRWAAAGPLLRLHAGLEDPDDLRADLAEGLARYAAAR